MTDWSKRTVLVTGGCGQIGSRLVEMLLERNTNLVRIVDNLSAYEFKQKDVYGSGILGRDNVQFTKGDITNHSLIRKATRNADVVFHIAAYADVGACIRNPEECFRSNVAGTHNMLKASLDAGVGKYVFASSAAVYGDQQTSVARRPVEFTEDMTLRPISNYANAKLWGESEARLFHQLHGLNTVSLRIFSVYGPRQIPKRGSHSWAVAIFAMRAFKGKTLQVFGNGEQVRDFVNARDIAESMIKAAETTGLEGQSINVGTGKPTTVKELALAIESLAEEFLNKKVDLSFKPRIRGDPFGGYADTRKMKQLLRWEPKVKLERGLKEYLEWMIQNPQLIPEYV
jgi:UDP-glucose 4-epimerase/dTDP-L-rhamnose 4-epimerase